jgi:large subunit ribosomal protein L21e
MTKRIGGFRRKTKSKLRKTPRAKGKISLTKYFQDFKIDQRVILNAERGYQKAMYHPRFHGKPATIIGKQGKCYVVEIKDGNKSKSLIVHGVHLKRY